MGDQDQGTDNSKELTVALLGRIAYKNDELKRLVQKGSKKPDAILKAYNLSDGKTSITDIAAKAGVAGPSLGEAVEKWQELGIALVKTKDNKVMPRKLFTIE